MNILLSGIVGSTAYGLAGPDSDIDRLGVWAVDTEALFGLTQPDETICHTGPDIALHEARKYATLALGGNPTVTELMWLPDDLYETRTNLGDELIAIRTAFLCARRVRDAYLGYATSQLKRLADTGQFASKMRRRQAKHGRHLLRLLDQGFALYSTGQLPIRVDDPDRYLTFGEEIANNPDAARTAMAEAEQRFHAVRSPLPDEPDRVAVEEWLQRVRQAHLQLSETL